MTACASAKSTEESSPISPPKEQSTSPSDDSNPIGKGTVISFREEVTFKNKGKTEMAILLTSVNDKNCSFSVVMKKGASYSITPEQKIVFKNTRKGVSTMKHPHTVYAFSAPENRTVELACTDRTDLTFEEVRDAWEFRGESAVIIKSE